MTLTERTVGRCPEGDILEYTIRGRAECSLRLMSYGATLTSLRVPDRAGVCGEVTLGYRTAEEFLSSGNRPYFGVTVGRFANRIRDGRFGLDGLEYRLARNDGGRHHLHGGERGFDKRLWRAQAVRERDRAGVRFHYESADGEEGYPGRLEASVEYTLSEDATLTMSYEARANAPTPVNLTNHTYWNLSGGETILDHWLELRASGYLEADGTLMPTGRVMGVEGSPFDFRVERRVGERIPAGGGYDHCYVLDAAEAGGLARAGVLRDEASGRAMEVLTTQPGLQLYSGNFLGTAGFPLHGALCLETQHYPDSVNHPEFPSPILRPGQTYRQSTVHRFTVR